MQNTEPLDRLYRISELEPLIGCRRAKAYRLIADGALSAVKVGASTFIPESEIRRFREANTRPVQPKRPQAAA